MSTHPGRRFTPSIHPHDFLKSLYFDRCGLCVWSKRLEAGRLVSDWRAVRTREMDWTGLKLLLEGIEVKRIRKRYRHTHTQMGEKNAQQMAL